MKKLLAILLCLALVVGCFAGCGQSAGSGTTFRKMYSGEVTTMNYLVTGSTNDLIIPANVIDTLVEYDAYGAIKPALAESWETSEDGLTWTFHLREGVKWYDYTGKEVAPVTAQDFVDAAIYALDAKNASSTEYMMEGIIANATEYYKYTSYLLESENGTKTTDEDGEAIEPVAEVKPEDVGVKAVDDLTLEYTLVQPTPYFLSVLNYGCYLPANGAFMQSCIAEDGTDMFGTDNTKLLYNGAYILSTFEPQGRRIMTKNPNYWDKDNVFIDAIEETYNKEMDTIAPEMFKRNETDLAYLSADILDAWLAADDTKNMVSPSRVDSSYSYFYAFNFEPKFDEAYEPDNWTLAVNNENFRQSIFHALDRVKAKTVMQPYFSRAHSSFRSHSGSIAATSGWAVSSSEGSSSGSLPAEASSSEREVPEISGLRTGWGAGFGASGRAAGAGAGPGAAAGCTGVSGRGAAGCGAGAGTGCAAGPG